MKTPLFRASSPQFPSDYIIWMIISTPSWGRLWLSTFYIIGLPPYIHNLFPEWFILTHVLFLNSWHSSNLWLSNKQETQCRGVTTLRIIQHTPDPEPTVYEGIPFIWGLGRPGVCSRVCWGSLRTTCFKPIRYVYNAIYWLRVHIDTCFNKNCL